MEEKREVVLSVQNLDVVFKNGKKEFKAVDDVSFDIYKGETFSLVGESGSGKTTIGRAIVRINPCSKGDIYYKGKKISGKLSRKDDREVVRKIQMIFQDPAASLNERATIEYIISEGLINFHLYKDEKDRINKVEKIIREVGLLPEHLTRYPHEFSGGQRQRVGLARSIVMEPEFIVADEPYFLPQATPDSMREFYCGYYPEWSDKTYQNLLRLFKLNKDAKIAGFSKGMQRQMNLLLGLSSGARFLLLDESFDGLDVSKRDILKRLLRLYAKKRNASIILSSHNMEELQDVSDRVGMIKDNTLVFDKPVGELGEGELSRMFLEEEEVSDEELEHLFVW